MSQDTKKIIELLQQGYGGINYLTAAKGGRHIIDVPVGLIKTHPDFSKIRGKDPKDLSLLQSSMRETLGPLYMPSLYIEQAGADLELFAADGTQRVNSVKANGDTTIVCQYIDRWDDEQKAFREAVGVQFAHYEPTEEDIISILRSAKLTQAEIASKTGLTESKISRLAKVAEPELEWLYKAFKDGILGLGPAGKLVDACNKNGEKLKALENTFCDKRAEAEEQRLYWDNLMKSKKRKWDKKTKDKSKIATYFKGFDWDAWVDTLESDDGVVQEDGVFQLVLDESAKSTKTGVRIGDVADWQSEFAVYGLFGQKIEDVDPEDIDYVLNHWEQLRDVLSAIRNGKTIPSFNPTKSISAPPAPAPQKPHMTVERTTVIDGEDEEDNDG